MLKHCAGNRKRLLSALPNVSPYTHIYTTLKFLALQGAPYIYISRLRVNAVREKIGVYFDNYTGKIHVGYGKNKELKDKSVWYI
jgi:hypothetical protein